MPFMLQYPRKPDLDTDISSHLRLTANLPLNCFKHDPKEPLKRSQRWGLESIDGNYLLLALKKKKKKQKKPLCKLKASI